MDAKTAVKILRESRVVSTKIGICKLVSPIEVEIIADFIEQQAKQIEEMKCCTNCKHGGGRWCELEGCINLNKWDGGSE